MDEPLEETETTMNDYSETFANRWFSVTFVWKDGLLVQTDLSADLKAATSPKSPYGTLLERIVTQYGDLHADEWPDLPLDSRNLSGFTMNVLDNLRLHAPRGVVTTYGRLAALCGSPRAARAVGGVMARNPWPLLYPCHRVLAANLGLGGFGPGIELKKTLLTLEKAPLPT
jgi:methylated-DNA-[protein]-cysteine S-methyltransferase